MKAITRLLGAVPRGITTTVLETLRRRKTALLAYELQRRATKDAADIIAARMPQALFCRTKFEVMDVACKGLIEGQVLEFGVYKGTTINYLAKKLKDRRITGFDSFEGLPKPWFGSRYSKVDFNRGGVRPNVEPNVDLVVGWFDQTVGPFFEKNTGPVALLHIDGDLYESAMTALRAARPFICPGTVIVFDEYFNYPGYQAHEYKALDDFAAEAGLEYTFIACSGEQAALKVTAIA